MGYKLNTGIYFLDTTLRQGEIQTEHKNFFKNKLGIVRGIQDKHNDFFLNKTVRVSGIQTKHNDFFLFLISFF